MNFFKEEKEKYDTLEELNVLVNVPSNANKIRQLYIDFFDELLSKNMINYMQYRNIPIEIDVLSTVKNICTMRNSYIGFYVEYDLIAEHINEIAGLSSVKVTVNKELKLGKFTLILEDSVSSIIPDETMDLLFKLGKVSETLNKSSITRAVFCETNNEMPF